ncbi:hypothetical protein PVK06_024759 [Gossypium arboreum]|uniref:Retrovirus-related Pol polyprotein from transposon TNT 1-94 n=1 Tax=Gossypium arboreum TaxID=29729 RepID=A0ABR0PES7_GOSAR|nr:hypothetical protein PVK06_024759 [Gossypium arboreum]
MMVIVNRMRTHMDKLKAIAIIEKILRSLLPKYNFVLCLIEEARDLDTVSFDELENSLMIHESKFAMQEEDQALQAISTPKDFGCGNNKWKGINSNGVEEKNVRKNGWDHYVSDGKPKAIDKS